MISLLYNQCKIWKVLDLHMRQIIVIIDETFELVVSIYDYV